MIPSVSIVILTFNRPDHILRNIAELKEATRSANVEIIVVDNCSDIPVGPLLDKEGLIVDRAIRLPDNIGVGGRNAGISAARGQVIVTLDDDVFGFSSDAIEDVLRVFKEEPDVAAVNFNVRDDSTGELMNWCHHRKPDLWADKQFDTYEISEGAVAFRAEVLEESGLYPEAFFISHEGPDLALRIMNCGYRVIYCPDITVGHAHAPEGRPGWRRYYYDTRNSLWLAARCYPPLMALRKLPISLGALLLYSVRDGFFRYWLKGVRDGISGMARMRKGRVILAADVWKRYHRIEKHHPGFWYMVKKRVLQRHVGI